MNTLNTHRLHLSFFFLLFVIISDVEGSSMEQSLAVPYVQRQGKIKIKSICYNPYGDGKEGKTEVFINGSFLYSMERHFRNYNVLSNDGKFFYDINFGLHKSNSPSITQYEFWEKRREYPLDSIIHAMNIEHENMYALYRYWSKYHNDRLWYKEALFRTDEIDLGFISPRITQRYLPKKISLTNEYIFLDGDQLYVLMVDNYLLKLSLNDGKISRVAPWYYGGIYANKSIVKAIKKYVPYKYPPRGTFPSLKDGRSFETFLFDEFKSHPLLSEGIRTRVVIRATMTLTSNGKLIDLETSVYKPSTSTVLYKAAELVEGIIKEQTFSVKDIPKDHERFCFTSWNERGIVIN
ncbi:hypothetical protein [Lewinella sp. LCG006]|uniref:hypothetical protein n=1 Tax=Lewinella sp. LCG006 TaxID=3231911 RepID=UPI0034605A72